jgi:hypothetical protein
MRIYACDNQTYCTRCDEYFPKKASDDDLLQWFLDHYKGTKEEAQAACVAAKPTKPLVCGGCGESTCEDLVRNQGGDDPYEDEREGKGGVVRGWCCTCHDAEACGTCSQNDAKKQKLES